MLNRDNKTGVFLIILVMHITSCNTSIKREDLITKTSKRIVSEEIYFKVYNDINDTLKVWCLNKLPVVFGESMWGYYLDSIICFNSTNDRLITSILVPCKNRDCVQDEIKFLYGEKIEQKWYFFRGESITIPREMVKGHPIHTPLTYQQLHQMALNEVYEGYLKPNGEINENWILIHFESNGWGNFEDQSTSDWFLKGKRYSNKKEFYEAVHLCKVKSNWLQRDTTKPIIYLPKKDSVL